MKKLLFFTSLMLCASLSFAQKKAVKDAKSSIDKTAEARELIRPALTDPETANDPQTWLVAGNIEFNAFNKQYDAELTKSFNKTNGWDEAIIATSLYNMIPYYIKADQLGQQPNEKGKIKNKVRKEIVGNFKIAHPFFINAGVYYNNLANDFSNKEDSIEAKANYVKAADLFECYWDIPTMDMFKDDPIEDTENTPIIKIYAVYASMSAGDHPRAIKLLNRLISEPYVENDTYTEESLYELLASEYQTNGDNDDYMRMLKIGTNKYPKSKYFIPNYISEMLNADKVDEAIELLDQAVANDPSSLCDLMSVKSSLLVAKNKYEDAIQINKDILAKDEACNRAIYSLGYIYALKAENLALDANNKKEKVSQKELEQQSADAYRASIPYLEKYRAILETTVKDGDNFKTDQNLDEYKNVIFILNSVYYSMTFLNDSGATAKFDETEKILTQLKALGYY